ncbi:MAG: hypothetical protein IKZ17_01390 [Bacteroidaceae bacterium]|nr:hypothetical protein [Bacteroidaceae bacterium]
MSEYEQSAIDFLMKCGATMSIAYMGKNVNPLWNDGIMRHQYNVVLHTPNGTMQFFFWTGLACGTPTEYDILSCLTKYDPGTIYDFMNDMGQRIINGDELKAFIEVYDAVCKEYNHLCRIFTPEQMEMLREIN